MAQPAAVIDSGIVERSVDQRVILHGVSWDDYEAVQAMRGESSAVRIAYLRGALELMTPSRDHETLKKAFARLLEAYAEELAIELEGYGSWTLKQRKEQRGAEPDECYSIGTAGAVPDLAIEVIWTSGGLDKLEIYRGLGVGEVWVWERRRIQVFVLDGEQYRTAEQSRLLPAVDLRLLERLLSVPSQTAAVRELRAVLRGR